MSCYTHINSHYKILYWSIFAVFIRAFKDSLSLHFTCTQIHAAFYPAILIACLIELIAERRKYS